MQRILTDQTLDIFVCPELLEEIKDVAGRAKIH
ncbi:hypothetical protein [Prevotella sp. OH937_COT-195]|nr:hypothetical protein [Prevotella sp. OH937_COT-195]